MQQLRSVEGQVTSLQERVKVKDELIERYVTASADGPTATQASPSRGAKKPDAAALLDMNQKMKSALEELQVENTALKKRLQAHGKPSGLHS
eukprot:m.278491 g.278491  ORF g.278491 m.278491 type:complete len:92 (-) comp54889_c0_seq1:962-1237(-)